MSWYRAVDEQRKLGPIHSHQKRMKSDARSQWFAFYFSLGLHGAFQCLLDKFVFFLADNENGAGRRANNTLRGAAHAQMPPTGVAVRGDHD